MILNGSSTQHPIPGVGFADDKELAFITKGRLDVSAAIDAVQAVRRNQQSPRLTWATYHHTFGKGLSLSYPAARGGYWYIRYDRWFGLVSEWHSNADAAHDRASSINAQLFRFGGYWRHDENEWMRPSNPLRQDVETPDVRDITAAAFASIDPNIRTWLDRGGDPNAVVSCSAPELDASLLVTMTEVSNIAGIPLDTLRPMRSRGDLPPPTVDSGRSPLWTRPVIADWASWRKPWHQPVRRDITHDGLSNVNTLGEATADRNAAISVVQAAAADLTKSVGGRLERLSASAAQVWDGMNLVAAFGIDPVPDPNVTMDMLIRQP